MVDEFTATVLGAAIAGGIGLFAVYIQQNLLRRDAINEMILGPLYNYLLEVEQTELGQYFGEDPWTKVGKYDRMKVPKRIRESYEIASASIREYETRRTDYSNFASLVARPAALPGFTVVLKPHLDASGRFPFKTLGIVWDGSRECGTILDAVYMSIIRHPGDEQATWREVEKSEVGDTWFIRRLVAFLRGMHPETLERMHRVVTSFPESARARELLATADTSQRKAVRDAHDARLRVQRRLRIRG